MVPWLSPRMQWLSNTILDKIDYVSHKVFVSHHGVYSVERLYAFESYCRSTSKLRAFAVCSLLSFPAFFVSIAIELIPLQNPDDGWRGNYGCWIRLYLTMFFVAFGANLQSNALIPELGLSIWVNLGASLATAAVSIIMVISVAALWVFPTPFEIVLNAFPFAFTCAAFFVLAVGPNRLTQGSSLRRQVVRRMYMIAVQATLMIVYPLFSIAYYWLPHQYKSSFVFLLPLIRIAMQHAVTRAMRDLEEYLPTNVVFCVGVFNALYMSKCMQSNGSRCTYGVIIALDAIQSVQTYRRLRKTWLKSIRWLVNVAEDTC